MGVSSSHLHRMFQHVLQQPPGAVARSIAEAHAVHKAPASPRRGRNKTAQMVKTSK